MVCWAVYCGLIIYWAFTLNKRILQNNTKKYLILVAFLMTLLIVLKIIKYGYHGTNEEISRKIWYLYYVSLIFAPTFGLKAAITLTKKNINKFVSWAMDAIAFVLLLSVLTNNLHQKCFSFNPEMANWDDEYTYGTCYYVLMAWVIVCLVGTVILLFVGCKLPGAMRSVWIPMLILLATFVCAYLCVVKKIGAWQMQEIYSAGFVWMYEACIRIGVIPSNRNYREIFQKAGLNAKIVDAQGNIYIESKREIEPYKSRQKYANLLAGILYWEEDISKIERLNFELYEIQAELNLRNTIIQSSNENESRRKRALEKNRLYAKISDSLKNTIDDLNKLLNDTISYRKEHSDSDMNDALLRHLIAKAGFITAYIKRKSNLMIIGDDDRQIGLDELRLSVGEFLEFIRLAGCNVSFFAGYDVSLNRKIEGEKLIKAYDDFAIYLKNHFDELNDVNVRINTHGIVIEAILSGTNETLKVYFEERGAAQCI